MRFGFQGPDWSKAAREVLPVLISGTVLILELRLALNFFTALLRVIR